MTSQKDTEQFNLDKKSLILHVDSDFKQAGWHVAGQKTYTVDPRGSGEGSPRRLVLTQTSRSFAIESSRTLTCHVMHDQFVVTCLWSTSDTATEWGRRNAAVTAARSTDDRSRVQSVNTVQAKLTVEIGLRQAKHSYSLFALFLDFVDCILTLCDFALDVLVRFFCRTQLFEQTLHFVPRDFDQFFECVRQPFHGRTGRDEDFPQVLTPEQGPHTLDGHLDLTTTSRFGDQVAHPGRPGRC
jgi:hypothetical protein